MILILVERWNDKAVFVSVLLEDKWIKPDLAFQRYSAGREPARHPLPVPAPADA